MFRIALTRAEKVLLDTVEVVEVWDEAAEIWDGAVLQEVQPISLP